LTLKEKRLKLFLSRKEERDGLLYSPASGGQIAAYRQNHMGLYSGREVTGQ
jgi:hypothetical protein